MADETGQQIGIMSREEALKLAQEKKLDLIEVAPMAKPRSEEHTSELQSQVYISRMPSSA